MIIAFGLFLAACTSEGIPNSFEDQNGRVERQFVNACVTAQEGESDAQESVSYTHLTLPTICSV